jgi:GWxTD domain-containing protein
MSSGILCRIKEEIIDSKGNTVKTLPVRKKKITPSGIVNINKTPVSALQSGMYDLKVEILGENGQLYDTKKVSFSVYRPTDFVHKGAVSSSNYDELYTVYLAFSESDLDTEFEQVSYIASSQDADIYNKLELEGKRKFLTEFWARQSDSAERNAMVTRSDYLERVKYANDRFTSGSDHGWKSDRGRVVILYGIPDDIEKYLGGGDTKQHEVWTYYELENGVKFIFVNVTGYGKYRLVHSTMHNEVKDYEWENRY